MKIESVTVKEDCSFKIIDIPSVLPDVYKQFLLNTNGGYTPDKYFHFFGLTGPAHHNVVLWNQSEWKRGFSLKDNWFIFAENIFGIQYFIKTKGRVGSVYMLDCSNGTTYFMADSYDTFIKDVVDDPAEEVIGRTKCIAKSYFEATKQNWEPFIHLSYKIPIVLGGSESETNNIEPCDSIVNLTILGQLIDQVKTLQPGVFIKDIQVDRENLEVKLIY